MSAIMAAGPFDPVVFDSNVFDVGTGLTSISAISSIRVVYGMMGAISEYQGMIGTLRPVQTMTFKNLNVISRGF